ncbi:DUF3037 domain-containing protein [Dyadobacter bucti]|uniref:DUF3037 domain-containing protein n=1 Tax=Dyadobacter bucti TaxID=2572203 RepID=UPI0011082A98|nr:DUF3037 domain-containing protein [Dyadobacter bucti]
MQENHLFEYAVIRVMPRVEREEFMNVGVILYCARQNYLKFIFEADRNRLSAFYKDIDIEEVEASLHALEKICTGGAAGGAIGGLPPASRFRWLTATRSTVIQASKVHPGFCKDPGSTLLKLFDQLVR